MTAGLSGNTNLLVGKSSIYHSILLYENTNSTWRRNLTNRGYYDYNITVGDNFVSLPTDYNFGNLTFSFMNSSQGFPSRLGNYTVPNGTTYGPFNITVFAAFNNSNQRWVSHLFNFTWANATLLEPARIYNFNTTPTIEVVWFASDYNVTWNGTSVFTNWTKYTR